LKSPNVPSQHQHSLFRNLRRNGFRMLPLPLRRSRRPYRHANQLPLQIETLIVRLKQDKPTCGVPKIREKLIRCYPDVYARDQHCAYGSRSSGAVGAYASRGPDSTSKQIELFLPARYFC
jgi:hypothetical protein